MKLFLCSFLLAHGALALKNPDEFGRTGGVLARDAPVKSDVEKHVLDEIRAFVEFERYLELSMSLSFSMDPDGGGSNDDGAGGTGGGRGGGGGGGGGSPSSTMGPTITPFPTTSPTVSPTNHPSGQPSMAPLTSEPSSPPSISSSPTITPAPTWSPAPTADPTDAVMSNGLFECTDQGVMPTSSPGNVTTPISLSVFYEAESMENTTDGFLTDLESALMMIALEAALDCDGTARRGLQQVSVSRRLSADSSIVGACNPTMGADNTCFFLQTDIAFDLNKDVDPDYAAYLAYSALQSAMENYTGDGIDTVVRLDYVAPTPTMPTGANLPESGTSGLNFSPFAIGACAAMLAGGTLAIAVWMHNRRTRNKRHVQLAEDQSLSPVSFFSAERDPYEDA